MEDTNRVYRIRTAVGENAPNVIHVPLKQSYDMFEILSLKLDQTNTYKTYESEYGVIVGRVTANGGFGVPNAKVSIFIEVSDDETLKNRLLYNFTSTSDTDNNGVRYNLLPDYVDDACHQDVGTFPNKRLVLDNQDVIEMFDKYWKYTTTTNHAGDYMLFGIPTGSQQLHVDVDLSDCGILSQRPRDMIGKGYNANMFESPNKFKSSTNLNSLAQIISQDRGLYVYPYWGDVSDGDDKFSITRCDINLEYKFESYAVFMGSIVTDKGSNAIGKNCTGTENNGKMSDLIAGEGTIEMIRKTLDNKVEEFPIMGNRLIDGDGVWCYQIPMNLDYVTTDEFGNLVPTDNPDKGIATRTRVRFRISLDENPNDATARKRARYLVPNNPRLGDEEFTNELEADYEFGTLTREESYCDMFWNKVYTVKNYIPKLQKNNNVTNRKHTGIKLINHYGDNNPMPYNALTIKLSFTYRLICVIVKVFILLIGFLNNLISILGALPCWLANIKILGKRPFKKVMKYVPSCIALSSEFCDDGINPNIYYPGCGKPFGCVWTKKTLPDCQKEQAGLPKEDQKICKNSSAELYTCVENELAQQNDATSFNFYNDWVNGVLYAPLWYRKIRPKKRFFFGLFRRKAKDEWCTANKTFDSLRIMQACSVIRDEERKSKYKNFDGKEITPYYPITSDKQTKYCKKGQCNKSVTNIKGMYGIILSKETMLGQTVYYYKAIEYDPTLLRNEYLYEESNTETPSGEVKLLFATDIVLLGSLNECDMNGIPQFFKTLESTTYNLPTDMLFTDHEITHEFDTNGNFIESTYTEHSEMAGCDWGNKNQYGKLDGGLFYSIGCSDITLKEKSCVNLTRICEYGVSLDETKEVPNLNSLQDGGDNAYESLITDGFVSWDELYNLDERSMFATMNGNKLKTKLNTRNGLQEYDFRYLYPENFDGSLQQIMKEATKKYNSDVTYRYNHKLEQFSRDYYIFRMGNLPYFYDKDKTFARYENSFYFYFGLKAGKTAIEKFNSKYFAECVNPDTTQSPIGIKYEPNSWCSELLNKQEGDIEDKKCGTSNNDGYLALDFSRIAAPYSLLINGVTYTDCSFEISDIEEEKLYFSTNSLQNLESKGYVQVKTNDNGQYATNGTPVPMFYNGSYLANVTDADGNIIEFTINIEGKYLTFKTEVQDFKQPNNVLWEKYGTYERIADEDDGVAYVSDNEPKQVIRTIGGVITIYDIYLDNKPLDEYKIEVRPEKPLYLGAEYSTDNDESDNSHKVIYRENGIYGIGVGKGDMIYTITITQTCGGVESNNIVTTKVYVKEPIPFKMYINDVDYDLIKNFNKIGDDYSNGWIPKDKIKNKKAELQNKIDTSSWPDGTLTYRGVLYENNPWFNIEKVWSNDNFKKLSNLLTIDDIDTESQTEITNFINQVNNKRLAIVNTGEPIEKTIAEVGETWVDVNGETTTANEKDVGNTVEDYVNYCTFRLDELLNEFTRVSVGGGVYYTWDGDYLITDFDSNSFNADANTYNADNIYDLVNIVNEFIEQVNEVIALRNELPSLMKDAFYMTCENENKTITISVQTSDMPYQTTLVYQEETAEEESDGNTLTTNNMVINYDSYVENISIPTITYACNEKYGFRYYINKNNTREVTFPSTYLRLPSIIKIQFEERLENTYRPVVAEVINGKNAYQKHAFYVGTANDAQKTIPNENGNPLSTKKTDNLWRIDENVYLNKLFDFPIIDKILNAKFIAWAFMQEIPYYRKYVVFYKKSNGEWQGNAASIGENAYNDLTDASLKNHYKPEYNLTTCEVTAYVYTITKQEYDVLTDQDKVLFEEYYELYGFVNKEKSDDALTIDKFKDFSGDKTKYMPIYRYNLEDITMNGSFAANIINGGFINDELDEQSLFGMTLRFSENLITQDTYVERRIVLGYKEDGEFDTNSNGLKGLLGFKHYIVEDDNNISDITQYAPTLPMQSNLTLGDSSGCEYQETIYGNMSVGLDGESLNNCITGEKIFVVQAENSSDEILYSVVSVDFPILPTDTNKRIYPLNYAEKEKISFNVGGLEELGNLDFENLLTNESYFTYRIGNEIKDLYEAQQEYNIFSYKMETSMFMNVGDGVINKRYESQTVTTRDDGSTSTIDTEGFGTTGYFNSKHHGHDYDPVFVVAQTNNNCRAISCVYDFSYVGGVIKYGTVERKDVNFPNEQGGTNTGGNTDGGGSTSGDGTQGGGTTDGGDNSGGNSYDVGEVVKDYKLGIGVKKGHYYFDNFKYQLYGFCKLSSVDIIDFNERTMLDTGQYSFVSIPENQYKKIQKYFKKESTLKQVISNTEITAIDRTGLRHICGIDKDDIDPDGTTWYTYIWVTNLPNGLEASAENGGLLYKGEYYDYIEFIYEKGEAPEFMDCTENETKFLGWTEDQPNVGGPFITKSDFPTEADSCKVYFGNWGSILTPSDVLWINDDTDGNNIIEPQMCIVHFRVSEADDAREMDRQEIPYGHIVLLRGECEEYTWYKKGDTTKTTVDFPYIVTEEEITFICNEGYIVNWIDNDEIYTDEYLFELTHGENSYTVDDMANVLTSLEILSSYNNDSEIYDTDYILDQSGLSNWFYVDSVNTNDLTHKTSFNIQIQENPTAQERSGKLVFTQRGSGKTIEIIILQQGKLLFNYRIINNRTSGYSIESVVATLYNIDDWQLYSGGGIPINGGYRDSSIKMPRKYKDTPLIIQNVEIGGTEIGTGTIVQNKTQTPSPYIWSGNGQSGTNTLILTILDDTAS